LQRREKKRREEGEEREKPAQNGAQTERKGKGREEGKKKKSYEWRLDQLTLSRNLGKKKESCELASDFNTCPVRKKGVGEGEKKKYLLLSEKDEEEGEKGGGGGHTFQVLFDILLRNPCKEEKGGGKGDSFNPFHPQLSEGLENKREVGGRRKKRKRKSFTFFPSSFPYSLNGTVGEKGGKKKSDK